MGVETAAAIGTFIADYGAAIAMAVSVGSALYQRQRAKKMQAQADAAADAAKGFQLVTEGEIQAIPIAYGRNKLGGVRVYHRVASNYAYAAPAAGGILFLSSGDPRGGTGTQLTVHATSLKLSTPISSTTFTSEWGSTVQQASNTAIIPIGGGAINFDYAAKQANLNVDMSAVGPIGGNWKVGDTIYILHGAILPPEQQALAQFGFGDAPEVELPYKVVSYTGTTLVVEFDQAVVANFQGSLNRNEGGNANEFLFIQQAICYGGVNDILAVDIDEKDWRDKEFGQSARIHAYPNGGTADPMMVANDASRSSSLFPSMAYSSMVFKINRDEPEYNSIPACQFYVEGMKMYGITGNRGARALTSVKTYTNNPAMCLMDYLTNPVYGRGLSIANIDLDSFYDASLICDRIVMTNKEKNGKLWTFKSGNRDIKLYECNLTIDTSKPVRENVETILETMGNSELVWSGGKYKLSVKYPVEYQGGATYQLDDVVQYPPGASSSVDLYRSTVANNTFVPGGGGWARDVVSAYLTDKDIIRDSDVSISYPSAQSRLNFCTVKFLDESMDFKENSTSWPPKNSSVYTTYLAEDNGIPLEQETFQTGDTTVYHAQATAEERVRSSRGSVVYKFSVPVQYSNLEPGDIIRVDSAILGILGELMKIEEVKIEETGTASIQCVKFDARQLAWNAKDDEIVPNRVILDTAIQQASNLTFLDTSNLQDLSSGQLNWTAAPDSRVNNYIIRGTKELIWQIDSETVWFDIGNTNGTSFDLPSLSGGIYVFAVVAQASDGRTAPFLDARTGKRWPTIDVRVLKSNPIDVFLTRNPVMVSYAANGTPDFTYASGTMILTDRATEKTETGEVVYSIQSQTGCTCTISNIAGTRGKFTVTAMSATKGTVVLKAVYKTVSYFRTLDVLAQNVAYIPDTTNSVTAPTGVVVTPNFSNVFIDTNQPTFTAGHGYAETRVYGAYWTTTLPTFANSKKIFTFNGSSAAMPTASTLKLRVWLTWVSKDGTESPATGGTNGFDATSLKVSGTDLGDAVVQAVNIAAGGIDASKFASDIQPVGFTASGSPLPTVKTTELMSWQGRLYKWNSTSGAYIYTTPAGDITGQLTDGQIAAVAAAKLTGSITSTQITDGSISTPKLAAGAVTTNELAAGAVTAGKIAAGTITATQIAADTITAAQIATGAITAAEIAAGAISVGTAAIANGAIVNAHIGTAAVDSIKIADGSVVNAKIGNMIKSANFNGAINGADQIIANGTTGWAIDKYGRAVFNDIWIRQLIDPVSNQMLYSTGIVGISGASPGDTSTPYWDGNMRIYGPDYHSTVGVNNRMRYSADRPISISVMATAVVDHYFTLWYRINGGSWAALASSIEPGPADGFATVFWTSNFQLASNIYLDFAVSGSNTSGGFFDFGKRYLTNLNFNVSVVNV